LLLGRSRTSSASLRPATYCQAVIPRSSHRSSACQATKNRSFATAERICSKSLPIATSWCHEALGERAARRLSKNSASRSKGRVGVKHGRVGVGRVDVRYFYLFFWPRRGPCKACSDLGEGEPGDALALGVDGGIRGLTFSPDGERLASAGADKTVRLWDPHSRAGGAHPARPARQRPRRRFQPGRRAAHRGLGRRNRPRLGGRAAVKGASAGDTVGVRCVRLLESSVSHDV
jgi:hypothetical protein